MIDTIIPTASKTTRDDSDDAELSILESIYSSQDRNPGVRQRDLANAAGASLGMTNAILKRLAHKGFIIVQRANSRNIQYAITPDGINEIARRSYRYFKRTIRNVVFYRERIDGAVSQAKLKGLGSVRLVGNSDLDFIVEHSCGRHCIPFFRAAESEAPDETFLTVYAEGIPHAGAERSSSRLFLSTILTGRDEE